VLRGAAGRRQDIPGALHRARPGRKFARISMGGMHDEAEIRATAHVHRRAAGQIIQALRRAGSNDPVFMLDEVDKLGRFPRRSGQRAIGSARPEQNSTYRDNYWTLPSTCPRSCSSPLQRTGPGARRAARRMEIISLEGYTEHER